MNTNMNTNGNGKQHQHQRSGSGARPMGMGMDMPCTSPWTEAFAFADEHQRRSEDQECQPTHDALSHIYNRGYA